MGTLVLFLRLRCSSCTGFHSTFNLENQAWVVHSVGGDGDGLVEAADVVGVVLHGDFIALAGHDGFFGPSGDGAAAGSFHVGKDEWLVAGVLEDELALAVAAFLYGAVVMFHLGELDLSAVGGSRLVVLSFCSAKSENCDKA